MSHATFTLVYLNLQTPECSVCECPHSIFILHNRRFHRQSISCHQPMIADPFGDTQLQNIMLKMSAYYSNQEMANMHFM